MTQPVPSDWLRANHVTCILVEYYVGCSCRHVTEQKISHKSFSAIFTCIMSSYYGNIMPTNLSANGSPESFYSHDTKIEASYYGTNGHNLSYDSDTPPAAYPRYPPYDRLSIRTLTSGKVPTSYAATPNGYHQHSGLAYSAAQNGQYHPHSTSEAVASCKLQEGGMLTTGQAVQPGHQNLQPSAMLPPYSSNTMGLPNGVQAQNIPIYPWMRQMNGGKYPLLLLLFLLPLLLPLQLFSQWAAADGRPLQSVLMAL